jgi:hypothetical protein
MKEKLKINDHVKLSNSLDPLTWIILLPLDIKPGNIGTIIKITGVIDKIYYIRMKTNFLGKESELDLQFSRNDLVKITNEEYLLEAL